MSGRVPVGTFRSQALDDIYADHGTSAEVLVLDGHGLQLRVDRGHLLLADGLGAHRRERRLSRAERKVRRIAILGHTGQLTLEAIRWCADVGIHLTQMDTDGRVLAVAGRDSGDDARLRRAQAVAGTGPTGLLLAIDWLRAKLTGQAEVLQEAFGNEQAANTIRDFAAELDAADSVARCLELESFAANVYFGVWTAQLQVRFAARDADKVPVRWHTFTTRRSPLESGRSPRRAADPANALLNYGYALGEAECSIALRAVGLDPGLGVLHADKRNRDSLALDLLETLRPVIDARIIRLLKTRHFRRQDFHETPDGNCRLLAPLTHELAAEMPAYARRIAPHAEQAAHLFASAHHGVAELRTPLTRRNSRGLQEHTPKRRSRTDPPRAKPSLPTCRTCGVALTETRRQLCATCWPVTRRQLATERALHGVQERARRRSAGEADPSNTAEASAKRSASLVAFKAAEAEWEAGHPDADADPRLWETIQPKLRDIPLARLQEATGLSVSACSRIRSGRLTPHARHWTALGDLSGAPANA